MPKSILSQVFYNMLISSLEKLKDKIEDGQYKEGFIQIHFIMLPKLDASDWKPFPGYQELKEKLNLVNQLTQLSNKVMKLAQKDDETQKAVVLSHIRKLTIISHLFNFIDCAYNDEKSSNVKNAEILAQTFYPDLFKTLNRQFTHDRIGRAQITNTVSSRPIATNEEHETVMSALNDIPAEQLENICLHLFASMDEIKAENMDSFLSKMGIDNLFILGAIKKIIIASNEYKREYKKAISEEETLTPLDPDAIDVITDHFENICRPK